MFFKGCIYLEILSLKYMLGFYQGWGLDGVYNFKGLNIYDNEDSFGGEEGGEGNR